MNRIDVDISTGCCEMRSPKFSIIIPFYNVAPYVRKCLDSVLAQSFQDWECICVDDGSPDGLGEILDEYASRDSRMRVLHEKNSGVAAARNAALDIAKGEWLIFVDGDDLMPPWALVLHMQALSQYPSVDMLSYGYEKILGEASSGSVGWPANPVFKLRDVSEVFDLKLWSAGFQLRVFRRSVYGDLRFPSLVRAQDRYYLLDCLFRTKTVVESDSVIYWYRLREGSTTLSAMTSAKFLSRVSFVKHMFDLARASRRNIAPSVYHTFCNILIEVLATDFFLLSLSDRKIVLKDWLMAIKLMRKLSSVGWFQRGRAYLLSICPFTPFIWLCGRVPNMLKLKGLHR